MAVVRRIVLLSLVSLVLVKTSCRGEREVVAVDRPRTLFDEERALNLRDVPPGDFRQIPATRFRALNYRVGPEGEVELFVGRSAGEVLPNANRWRRQFGLEEVGSLTQLTEEEVLSTRAWLLEGQGDYTPGMGRESQKGWAFFGAIVPTGDGQVLTVKMVGPQEAVEGQREAFYHYVKGLELSRGQRVEGS